ncbi:MAG: hypothetical protein IT367_15085 [Candidatus Hydrogenedentes bacterium]|nr:hypothetical protein [Candidatus Hydrogenedentota bacterium]
MIEGIVSLVVGLIGAVIGLVLGLLGIIVGIVVPVLIAIVVPLLVCGVPLLLVMAVVWLLGLPSARRARRKAPEDMRTMRDIDRGLARMQNRLDSLETIMRDDPGHYSTR